MLKTNFDIILKKNKKNTKSHDDCTVVFVLYLNNVILKILSQDLKALPTSVGMQHNTNHRSGDKSVQKKIKRKTMW